MSSYAIAQEYNLQTVLWSIGSAPFTLVRFLRSVRFGWLFTLQAMLAPDVKALAGGFATVALWLFGVATVVGALMLVLAVPEVVIAAVVILTYALVFKPR